MGSTACCQTILRCRISSAHKCLSARPSRVLLSGTILDRGRRPGQSGWRAMRAISIPSTAFFLLALSWSTASPAQDKASDTTPHQSFYGASLSFTEKAGTDSYAEGYAAIQWLSNGDVTGRICVYGPDADNRKVEYDELSIAGRNSADGKLDLR